MSGFSDDAWARLGDRRLLRIGFGGYRIDDRHAGHRAALAAALDAGVNVVDTSANYGDGHSEVLVGEVLRERGMDPFVVTKAGYVQGSNLREADRREKAGTPWSGLVRVQPGLAHALGTDFLRDQLAASLSRLGRGRVDAFLLHNPEYHLEVAHRTKVPLEEARGRFYATLRSAFALLEDECDAGRIGVYGVSSNTFVVPRERPDAVDLTRVLEAAGPRFKVVQLPMNPLETGARAPHHTTDGRSVLDVARERDLFVLVNRPLNAFAGGRLVRFAEIALPFEPAEPHGDALAALAMLEDEFAERWGGRIRLEGADTDAGTLLRVSPLLGEMQRGARDLMTFAAVWEDHVAPRLEEVLPSLAELLAADEAFGAFRLRYERTLRQAATSAAQGLREAESLRAAERRREAADAFGPRGGTLSQETLRGLLSVDGVSCVLVGMRREAYVRDAVGALA